MKAGKGQRSNLSPSLMDNNMMIDDDDSDTTYVHKYMHESSLLISHEVIKINRNYIASYYCEMGYDARLTKHDCMHYTYYIISL
jgi:hypothetical protein